MHFESPVKVIRIYIFCDFDAYTQQGTRKAFWIADLQSRFTRKTKGKGRVNSESTHESAKVPSQQVLLLHTSCTVVERMVAQHLARKKQKLD
jgi:ribosomal protein L44E